MVATGGSNDLPGMIQEAGVEENCTAEQKQGRESFVDRLELKVVDIADHTFESLHAVEEVADHGLHKAMDGARAVDHLANEGLEFLDDKTGGMVLPLGEYKEPEVKYRLRLVPKADKDACVLQNVEAFAKGEKVKLVLASHEGVAIVYRGEAYGVNCANFHMRRLGGSTLKEALEVAFDGFAISISDGSVLSVPGVNMEADCSEVITIKDRREGASAKLRKNSAMLQNTHFTLNADGTLSPSAALHVVLGLEYNIIVNGPNLATITIESIEFTREVWAGLFLVLVRSLGSCFLAAIFGSSVLFVYRYASDHSLKTVVYLYVVGHQILYPPWGVMLSAWALSAIDPTLTQKRWGRALMFKIAMLVTIQTMVWSTIAWFSLDLLMQEYPEDWLRYALDMRLCMGLCAVSVPTFLLIYFRILGFPAGADICLSVVVSITIQLVMLFYNATARTQTWLHTLPSWKQVLLISSFSTVAVCMDLLISKIYSLLGRDWNESWKRDGRLQDLRYEVLDMVAQSVGLLTQIAIKMLVIAVPDYVYVFVLSSGMAVVEFFMAKWLVHSAVVTMRRETGEALQMAKMDVAQKVTLNFTYMQLEYIVIISTVFAAYIFNNSETVNRFGGDNNWNLRSMLSMLAAQLVPEMIGDYLGLAMLGRAGVDVPAFYKELSNNPLALATKATGMWIMWSMAFGGALNRNEKALFGA